MRIILAMSREQELYNISDLLRRRFPGGEVQILAGTSRPQDLLQAMVSGQFEVMLVDADMANLLGGWLRNKAPNQAAVVVTRDLADPRLPRLKALGVWAVQPDQLEGLFREWMGLPAPSAQAIHPGMATPPPPAPEPATTADGKLITVHSPKGGTGKSTVAAHLAVQFTLAGLRTALVDLSLYGSLAALFKLQQRGFGVGELISLIEQDEGVVKEASFPTAIHKAFAPFPVGQGRLDVLPAAAPMRMAKLSGEMTEAILGHLKAMPYDKIVVDTSAELSERNLAALGEADHVLLVATPDVACGWNLLQLRDVFGVLGLKGEVLACMNRHDPKVEFDPQEFQQLSGYRVAVNLPEVGSQLQKTANHSTPLELKQEHPFVKAICQLGGHLVQAQPSQGGSRR